MHPLPDAADFDDTLHDLNGSNQSGVLTVNYIELLGAVFFDKGQVVAAQISQGDKIVLDGPDALYCMASWQQAEYSFESQSVATVTPNIFSSYQELQVASIFQREEWRDWSPADPCEDTGTTSEDSSIPTNAADRPLYQLIPYTKNFDNQKPGQIELTPDSWSVLMHANGQTTVEQIALKAKMPLDVVVETVYALVQRGLLGLNPGNAPKSASGQILPAIFTNRLVTNPTYQLNNPLG